MINKKKKKRNFFPLYILNYKWNSHAFFAYTSAYVTGKNNQYISFLSDIYIFKLNWLFFISSLIFFYLFLGEFVLKSFNYHPHNNNNNNYIIFSINKIFKIKKQVS